MHTHRAFTLIELIAVIVVLAILAGVALPKYFDYANEAKTSADEAAIGGIRSALSMAFIENRANDSPNTSWITWPGLVKDIMETGQLPENVTYGLTVDGWKFQDQRGYYYTFSGETAIKPATLTKDAEGEPGFSL